jgi:hypothetical protein
MSRVGVLWDTNAPEPVIAFQHYETAAEVTKYHSIAGGTRSEP